MLTYKFSLKPNLRQETMLNQTCAAVRAVFNAANEQRRLYERKKGTDAHGRDSSFKKYRQVKEVSTRALKQDADLAWLTVATSDSFGFALDNLDQAWNKYFDNLRKGIACDKPSFRNASDKNSFKLRAQTVAKGTASKKGKFNGRRPNILFNNRGVKLPKIGWVSMVKHIRVLGDPRTVTVKREGSKWFICISSRLEVKDWEKMDTAVGIDLGSIIPVATSTGEQFPRLVKTSMAKAKRIKNAQRAVSRSKRRSQRRRVKVAELARLKRLETKRVRCELQKTSRSLVNRFGTIVIENLKVSNLTKSAKGNVEKYGKNVTAKSRLNREMLAIPKFGFRSMLEYKAKAAGGEVIAVCPAYTSQTCSSCRVVDKLSRQNQSTFLCTACGHQENADINAAKNILIKSGDIAVPRKAVSELHKQSATPKSHEAPPCAALSYGCSMVEAADNRPNTTPCTGIC